MPECVCVCVPPGPKQRRINAGNYLGHLSERNSIHMAVCLTRGERFRVNDVLSLGSQLKRINSILDNDKKIKNI